MPVDVPFTVPAVMPFVPLTSNSYVPWDVSYLNTFSSYVRQAMGSSTNVGILAFAVIVGIGVVIWIVRRFTR